MKHKFKRGDSIKWQYTHRCGWSSWDIGKHGVFLRLVKHRVFRLCPMAAVHFEGNKGETRVPVSELRPRPARDQGTT